MKTLKSVNTLILLFALLVAIGYIIELKTEPAFNKTNVVITDTVTVTPSISPTETVSTYKTNINTAKIDELCKLKGIGKSTAQKIIDYRTENGAFKSVEDLLYIKGIGEKTLAEFKDSICVK